MGFCVFETLPLVLIALLLGGCEFDTTAAKPVASTRVDAGKPALDAGNHPPTDTTSMQPADLTDAGRPPGSGGDDGGVGGSSLGTPDDPTKPTQNGGIKCGGVFCPFADAPIEPCCTTKGDVKGRLAKATDRCGLSFGKTGSDFFGDGCWQRDQPGVVDDTCPGVQVDLRSENPGCCNDQGTCGGIDTEHGLGCHSDPAAKAQTCGAKADPDGKTCDPRGVYAVRMEVDLAWGGRSGGLWDLTDDGRGKMLLNLRVRLDDIDANENLRGRIDVCGVELPTFYSSTLCEAYQPIFPTSTWESPSISHFDLGGHLQCLKPGCIASIDAQTVLLGISLDNPEAPWPTANQTANLACKAGRGAECFPDEDEDDRPGLTVALATDGTSTEGRACNMRYANNGAPLSSSPAAIVGGVRRTDRILLGVRMKVGLSFKLDNACEGGKGLGIAEFVNSRAVGCVVQPGTFNAPRGRPAGPNDPCTANEASFMDANLPIYTVLDVDEPPASNLDVRDDQPSLGPLVSVVRLGDLDTKASCAEVRDAAYP